MVPTNLHYSEGHVWLKKEGKDVLLGVTEHFLRRLHDPTHIELPEPGETVDLEMAVAEIDSTNQALEVVSPVEGKIVEVNNELAEAPSDIMRDPYEDGWLVRVRPSSKLHMDDLMSAEEYEDFAAFDDEEEDEPELHFTGDDEDD